MSHLGKTLILGMNHKLDTGQQTHGSDKATKGLAGSPVPTLLVSGIIILHTVQNYTVLQELKGLSSDGPKYTKTRISTLNFQHFLGQCFRPPFW